MMLYRPELRDDAVERPFVGRHYRSCFPAKRWGYESEDSAKAALAEVALPPGSFVAYEGEARQFVGFSKTRLDPWFLLHIPKLLIRSPNGDIWVSLYDLDEAKVIGLQVVSIHQGSDWGVVDIREGEPFDPAEDYQLADHAKACASAARLAREFGCNWFDLSTVEEK